MSELDLANARREIDHLQRECGDLREFITAESRVTTEWRDQIHNLHQRLGEEIARVTRAENALREVLVACDLKEQVAVAAGRTAEEATIFTVNIRTRITEAMTP